jgi:hypothetical protein
MKSTIKIIAALSMLAAAGCAGKLDQVATADEVTQIMTVSELKVAIADNAPSGNVYEYSSPMPAPVAQHDEVTQFMAAAVQDGNVYE